MPTMNDRDRPAMVDLPRGELVTISEAARLIGVSQMTIGRWMKKGAIVYVTFGSTHLIPTMEIEPARKMLQENVKIREEALKRGRSKKKTNQPAGNPPG